MTDPQTAERALLGAILLGGAHVVDRVTAEKGLRAEHFGFTGHAATYRAMMALADKGVGIEVMSVVAALKDAKELGTAGGPQAIDALTVEAFSPGHAVDYAGQVIEGARWRARSMGNAREREAIDQRDDDAYLAARNVTDQSEPERGTALDGPALLADFCATLEAKHGGIGLPWKKLEDAMFGGGRPGDLTVIAAFSSMGKSLAMGEWAEHVGDMGMRSAIYTNELSPGEVAARLVAGRQAVTFGRIMLARQHKRPLRPAEFKDVAAAYEKLPVSVVAAAGWPWEEIASDIRRHKWDWACLDLFNNLPGLGKVELEDAAITGLANAAAQAGTHLVVIAHLKKRSGGDGELTAPSQHDIRGSGMLYNRPRNVMFVHQDQEQDEDTDVWQRTGRGMIWLDKVANGAPGPGSGVRFTLNPDRMRLEHGDAWKGREAVAEAEQAPDGDAMASGMF